MYRLAALLGLVVSCTGCTVERIHRDAEAGLDYLRLSNGSQISASSRWQFSPDTRIVVNEVAPAPRGDWLTSAQEGIASVFHAPPVAQGQGPTAEIELLIAWSGPDPLNIQVFLHDAQTRALIQAATLDLSPRWLSGKRASGEHVRDAFQDYAQGLVSRF